MARASLTITNTAERRPLEAVPSLTNFLNRRRIEDSRRQKKRKLAPEGYRTLRAKLNNCGSLAPNDADETKSNINNVKKKLIRFCQYTGEGDWREALQNWDKGATMLLLRFICENDRVTSENALHQYLRTLKMLYNRVNGFHMDMNDAKEALKYLQGTLTTEFGLSRRVKAKPVMGPDDLLLLLTHHWARDTHTYPIEDQRLTVAAIMLMAVYTGCRLGELTDASKGRAAYKDPLQGQDDVKYEGQEPWEDLDDTDYIEDDDGIMDKEGIEDDHGIDSLSRRYKVLCYEDIRLWIVQNPKQGERDLLAMEVTLSHHKGANWKLKPTTFLFREEALPILCPISHILALAIRDDAFKLDGLTSAEPFFTTNLQPPMKAMKVHWKLSMLKAPIFRQVVRSADGLQTSEHKALRYSTFAYYFDRLGWGAGFPEKLTSYCMRRGTGNAVDGATTTAVRDQIIRHDPNSGIFNAAYLNEKVRFDVQAAFLERPSNDGLTRAFTHMSITCNPCAPTNVPEEVMDALPPDPDIVYLEKQQEDLFKTIQKKYGFLNRAKGTESGKKY